jgi:hypothetical protein
MHIVVTGLSPWGPGINLRPVYVGFLVDRVAKRQVLLRVLRVFPVSVVPPLHFTRTGEPFLGRVLKLSINFEEFPAGAHRNFEEKNEVFVFHNDY